MKSLNEFSVLDDEGRHYAIYEAVMTLDSRMNNLEHKVDSMVYVCDDVDMLKHQVGIMWAASKVIAGLILTSIVVAMLVQIGLK